MTTYTPGDNEVINIKRQNDAYHIEISIYQAGTDELYFQLEQRNGEQEIKLQASFIRSEGRYNIYKIYVLPPQYENFTQEKDYWDLYIYRGGKEGFWKSKVKTVTGEQELFYLSMMLENHKMFYPYRTKNGRLAFSYGEPCLFAHVDDVSLSEKEVHFSGRCYYPPLAEGLENYIKAVRLTAKTGIDDQGVDIPVEFGKFGFKATFSVDTNNYYKEKKSYLFQLEMTLSLEGTTKIVQSGEIKWISDKRQKITKIIQSPNEKLKICVAPSKSYKILTIDVSSYNFKREIVSRAKDNWVKFRRGKFVQEVYRHAFLYLSKLPAKKRLVMFESFHGKQYSDSPRAIYEYMKNDGMNYDMYWSADRRHVQYFDQLQGVKSVRRFSLKWLMLMARAGYWVTNARLPLWLPKPKQTVYLQTWHGTPLKRLAADMEEVHMPGTNTDRYKENFLFEASKWDYLVSPNAYSSEIFQRAFGFEKTMIESGYPRNDFLINCNNEETIHDVKNKCNLPENKKVILYAPTWRDNQFYAKGKYKFDLELDFKRMREEFGKDYVIILRLHYLVAENLDLAGYEDFVYDLSAHDDIRDLYLISDMLITDYSSVFFDYANLKRPMLFFVYDIEDYRDNLRGFYFDFEAKAPGPLVKTSEELISAIKCFDQNGLTPTPTIEAFYQRFCYLEDGQASARVAKEVFKS